MKILFLCSASFDYLQDLTYSGLVKVAGADSVIDYPFNPKFHFPIKRYPKNIGYTKIGIRIFPAIDFKKMDVVILASAKKDVLETYQRIYKHIADKPIVFLDGGDRPEIGGDFYRTGIGKEYENIIKKRAFDYIFKREYFTDLYGNQMNVFPFPFSFPYNLVEFVRQEVKKYEVSFWAQQYPEIRESALKLLQGKFDCEKNGTTLNQNFDTYKRRGKFYLEEIARCKIVLNFRGGGWDTMRYWEVPGVGTLMISQKPQIFIPDNFEDGKHVIWCSDSLDDLVDKIRYYLQNDSAREDIARNATIHLKKFHLNTHRAQFLFDTISNKI